MVVVTDEIINKFLQKLILIFKQWFCFPEVVRSQYFVLDEVRQNLLEVGLSLDVIDGIFISGRNSFLGSDEPTVVEKEVSSRYGLQKGSLTSYFKLTDRRVASFQWSDPSNSGILLIASSFIVNAKTVIFIFLFIFYQLPNQPIEQCLLTFQQIFNVSFIGWVEILLVWFNEIYGSVEIVSAILDISRSAVDCTLNSQIFPNRHAQKYSASEWIFEKFRNVFVCCEILNIIENLHLHL